MTALDLTLPGRPVCLAQLDLAWDWEARDKLCTAARQRCLEPWTLMVQELATAVLQSMAAAGSGLELC